MQVSQQKGGQEQTVQCLIQSYITKADSFQDRWTIVEEKTINVWFHRYFEGFFSDNDWEVFHKVNHTDKHLVVIFWFAEGGKRKRR